MGDYFDNDELPHTYHNPTDWVCPYCLIRFKADEKYKYSAHIKNCPKKSIKK